MSDSAICEGLVLRMTTTNFLKKYKTPPEILKCYKTPPIIPESIVRWNHPFELLAGTEEIFEFLDSGLSLTRKCSSTACFALIPLIHVSRKTVLP